MWTDKDEKKLQKLITKKQQAESVSALEVMTKYTELVRSGRATLREVVVEGPIVSFDLQTIPRTFTVTLMEVLYAPVPD